MHDFLDPDELLSQMAVGLAIFARLMVIPNRPINQCDDHATLFYHNALFAKAAMQSDNKLP